MNRTPWSGSLVSDRLKPSRPSSPNKQQQNTKGKGKEKEKENDKPKSEKVKELEGYIVALSGSPPKNSKRLVCFCQARTHSLSTYFPICTSCGLILCTLNHSLLLSSPSSVPCPHCTSSLFPTPQSRDALLTKLVVELDDVKEKERIDDERKREEMRLREGAFPVLASSASATMGLGTAKTQSQSQSLSQPQPKTHKVLSLGSKSKKATVTTYTVTPPSRSPAISAATSRAASPGPTLASVPPPPSKITPDSESNEGVHVGLAGGPWWTTLRGPAMGIRYVPVPVKEVSREEGSSGGRRRRRGKSKATNTDETVV